MEKVGIKVKMLDGELHYIPLDDIIFIEVDLKFCSFYLKNETPQAIIGLTTIWNMITKAAMGLEHHFMKVGRDHIINMDYYVKSDPSRNVVTLRRDPFTISSSELVKKGKRDLPRNVMAHIHALKQLHGKTDSEKPDPDTVEVPMKYFEVPIGEGPMKELLKKKEKWFGVLDNYALQKELTVSIDELNDKLPTETGHEYIDLGLKSGTLWAAHNLNQISYFAWGELYENDVFDETEYIHKKGISGIIDPTTSSLSIKYDAAHHFWGGGWRMPTKEECEELINSCTLNWCITKNKVHGCLLTGPNGHRIFLPAMGFFEGNGNKKMNELCTYWTSSSEFDKPILFKIFEHEGEALEIKSLVISEDPYIGLPIRPVISKDVLTEKKGNMKRMLIIDDFFADEDDFLMQGLDPVMDGWIIKRLTPSPTQPDDAANMIESYIEEYTPDVVVAFKAACFWGQKIKDRLTFLVEPDYKMSESISNNIALEQDDEVKAKWLKLQEYYESKEEELTEQVPRDDCWVLAEDADLQTQPQLDNGNYIELMPPQDPSRWVNTRLFPIIKEVTDRRGNSQPIQKSLYERKFLI